MDLTVGGSENWQQSNARQQEEYNDGSGPRVASRNSDEEPRNEVSQPVECDAVYGQMNQAEPKN
jgi:hypothetical protein